MTKPRMAFGLQTSRRATARSSGSTGVFSARFLHSKEEENKAHNITARRRASGCASRLTEGIAHEDSFLHLEKGDQSAAEYRAINPQMVVPTLVMARFKLLQRSPFSNIWTRKYPEPP